MHPGLLGLWECLSPPGPPEATQTAAFLACPAKSPNQNPCGTGPPARGPALADFRPVGFQGLGMHSKGKPGEGPSAEHNVRENGLSRPAGCELHPNHHSNEPAQAPGSPTRLRRGPVRAGRVGRDVLAAVAPLEDAEVGLVDVTAAPFACQLLSHRLTPSLPPAYSFPSSISSGTIAASKSINPGKSRWTTPQTRS